MCASDEGRVSAKRTVWKRMPLRTKCAGGGCCEVDRGVRGGDGGWLGMEYECEGVEGSGSGRGDPASGRNVETAFPWEFRGDQGIV